MIILIFIIGIFFGSFFNVIIDRLPRGETVFKGRSHCDFCHHTLSAFDLIPLFSFLFLKGTCRYCRRFIGWKYPVIEVITGVLFALTYAIFSASTLSFLLSTFACISCLLIIFFTDLFSGVIPDKILIILFLFALLRIPFLSQSILSLFLTPLFSGLFFLVIFLLTKGQGMGFGDVKYSVVMGLLLGFPTIIPGFYIAFLTGAFVALILVIARRKRFHQTIPFGPFLVVGTMANMFWGPPLWILLQKILGL